jgi:hypothetical protein
MGKTTRSLKLCYGGKAGQLRPLACFLLRIFSLAYTRILYKVMPLVIRGEKNNDIRVLFLRLTGR